MPHPDFLNAFMRFVARIMNRGDGWLFGVVLSSLFDPRTVRRQKIRRLHRIALPLWLATATVEFVLKSLFRRQRPFLNPELGVLIGRTPRRHSFPSGHSAAAFGGAWLLSRQYPRWQRLFYGIALVVGFCRVYLGAHYPSDVVAGAASGLGLAAFYRRIFSRRTPYPTQCREPE